MQKKTYSSPEIQTITMLTEGMIAVSGKPELNNPVGGPNESQPVTPGTTIGSRQKDLDNNSIWD
jgi:hypothetical protein